MGITDSIGCLSRGFAFGGAGSSGESETKSTQRVLGEQEEGVAHSEAQEGEGTGLWNRKWEVNTGKETEDLTWGYKTPQGQLFILEIRQRPRRGV